MALIISLGSNIGDRLTHLKQAGNLLERFFKLTAASRIYHSKAVDYEHQPDFYNQLLQFELPQIDPRATLDIILGIEKSLGRTRLVPKGPRTIDIDIIFWQLDQIDTRELVIPHPRLFSRSFIVLPLQELPYYEILSKRFSFPDHLEHKAVPIN